MAVDKIDVALVSGVAEKEPQLYEILKKTVEKVNGVVEQTNTDVAVAASSGPGDPAGTIKMFGGFRPPSGYLLCNGATVSRNDQKALFEAITIPFHGSLTAASNQVTQVPAAVVAVADLRAGMVIQGPGIPVGTTITGAVAAGLLLELVTITMSAVAATTVSRADMRVLPWGEAAAPDQLTKFVLPDLSRRFPLGFQTGAFGAGRTLGESGGTWDHTHTGGSHTHTVAAHGHTLSAHTHAGPSHTHDISHDHTVADGSWTTFGENESSVLVGAGALNNVSVAGHTHDLPNVDETISGAGLTSGAGGTGNTGGPSTDATSNTSLTTDAGGAVATTAANPPYVVVNFIIKT